MRDARAHRTLDPDADDVTVAAELARRAGELLVELRADSFAAELPDGEAGRRGDLSSNRLILSGLAEARPADAVLSEESVDDRRRLDADRVWIIDPLDGTREYQVPGRTDWAVHVGLWERAKEITAAAVGLPALGAVLTSAEGPTLVREVRHGGPVRVAASRSRAPEWLGPLGRAFPMQLVSLGSAGAKAMAVVRGDADAYVHGGGQWEWDSAAPVGVVLAAGLHASRLDGSPLRYNQDPPYLPDLVICRPDLADSLLAALASVGAA